MEIFLNKLAEILEVDEVQSSSVLRDFAEWDSLSALSVIAMLHSDYGVSVGASDLKNANTAEALFELVLQKMRK
jgi:acyl carrier protein